MSIVYLRKKETGITYVYENQAFWDKTKQQSRSKRKLLGKLDPETKEIIPTRPYRKHDRSSVQPMIPKPGPVPITQIRRSFYGASYLFDQIGKLTGVEADLKACFPDTYQKILSIAYFLILEDNNSLSRFSHWQKLHSHPYGEDISSQRSSELFQSIEEQERMAFFRKQGKRRLEKEYWAYDITTISSYSDVLKQVKKGKNKEQDRYFEVQATPKRGIRITPKEEVIAEEAKHDGYFALLSNEVKDPFEALSLYRSKDIVEKAFGNLKERLNFRRLQVSSELSLNGKLFVEFIALIYLSYVKQKMQEAKLFESWTLQGLLDELDTIELLEAPGYGRTLGEITEKQKSLYQALGVEPPSL